MMNVSRFARLFFGPDSCCHGLFRKRTQPRSPTLNIHVPQDCQNIPARTIHDGTNHGPETPNDQIPPSSRNIRRSPSGVTQPYSRQTAPQKNLDSNHHLLQSLPGNGNLDPLKDMDQTNTMADNNKDSAPILERKDVKVMKKTEVVTPISNPSSIEQKETLENIPSPSEINIPSESSTQPKSDPTLSSEIQKPDPAQISDNKDYPVTDQQQTTIENTTPPSESNLPPEASTPKSDPTISSEVRKPDLINDPAQNNPENPGPNSRNGYIPKVPPTQDNQMNIKEESHQKPESLPAALQQGSSSARPSYREIPLNPPSRVNTQNDIPIDKSQVPAAEEVSMISSVVSEYSSSKLNKRGFDNPTAKECFANALFQTLYNMPGFRTMILKSAGRPNEIRSILCKLFQDIENEASCPEIQNNKKELIRQLERKNPGITILGPKGGDSRTLFQLLASGICEQQPFDENPVFSLFSTGDLEKAVKCPECEENQKETTKVFTEKLLMISAQEELFYDPVQEEPKNFFQKDSEMRRCQTCKQRIDHTKKISLKALPKIMAVKIEDSSVDTGICTVGKPHKILKFPDPKRRDRKVTYKFFGGVYNTRRGFDGSHSVAYVRENQNGDFIRQYNDSMVSKTLPWDDMSGYAKLLFYCKVRNE